MFYIIEKFQIGIAFEENMLNYLSGWMLKICFPSFIYNFSTVNLWRHHVWLTIYTRYIPIYTYNRGLLELVSVYSVIIMVYTRYTIPIFEGFFAFVVKKNYYKLLCTHILYILFHFQFFPFACTLLVYINMRFSLLIFFCGNARYHMSRTRHILDECCMFGKIFHIKHTLISYIV